MTLTKQQILDLWETSHGTMSEHWRARFLESHILDSLVLMDRKVVAEAMKGGPRLRNILEEANRLNAAFRAAPAAARKRRSRKARGGSDRSRYSYGHFPQQPNDSDLHRKIGRTQSYGDNF